MKKLVTTRLKYIFDDIFKGKTPIYSEEEINYIILGQRNNSKGGLTLMSANSLMNFSLMEERKKSS